jgi:hypothetical protein
MTMRVPLPSLWPAPEGDFHNPKYYVRLLVKIVTLSDYRYIWNFMKAEREHGETKSMKSGDTIYLYYRVTKDYDGTPRGISMIGEPTEFPVETVRVE